MTVASSTAIITDMIGDIGDTLAGGLPEVLTLVGILIGLMFVIRFIMRRFGGTR